MRHLGHMFRRTIRRNGTQDSSPAVANGVVYIGSYDYYIYALNAATGAKLWSFDTGNNGYIDAPAAIADGVV
jgi:outer membrane protein assembly factor BamB